MTRQSSSDQVQQRVGKLKTGGEQERPAREEFVRRQKYLEAVLHHAPDAIVTLNASHQVIEWNPGAERIFGYTCKEAMGRDLDSLITRPDVYQEAKSNTSRVMSGHSVPPQETVRYAKDGAPVQVIVSGSPIFLNGSMQGVVAVYTDITNRKNIEKALDESEQAYRVIFENTGTATIIVNTDTTIILANKEFEKISGYRKEELEGRMSWRDFVALEEDLHKMEIYHRLRREDPSAAPNSYEFRFQDKEGRIRNVVNTVDMIPGSEQSVASFLDVTGYKKLQDSLQQERDSLDNILENSADAIVIVDAHGRFTRWNRRAAEQFGYEYEEIVNQKAFDYYSDRAEMGAMLEKLRRDNFVRDYEISYQRKDGSSVPCSVSIKLLRDTADRIIGSVSIIRDMTEWKKVEERLNYMSFHDSLTGLYNRNYFQEEMKRLRDGRYAPLGIIVCDLDGLKSVNDTLGHEHGDRLLISTANLLRRSFRASDILARIGGDEFSVLIPQTTVQDMENLVKRLRTSVDEYNQSSSQGSISLSIGYAISDKQPVNIKEIFTRADQMMYREKMQRDGCRRKGQTS